MRKPWRELTELAALLGPTVPRGDTRSDGPDGAPSVPSIAAAPTTLFTAEIPALAALWNDRAPNAINPRPVPVGRT